MANEPSKTPTPQPQSIPLAKIHDLPGAAVSRQPDKSYGGLVTSIQASGVKEPVVLRLREDGEYQLVTGYRRRRACELAKVKDIPALVYEMSLPSALNYHRQVKNQPGIPIPGQPVPPPTQDEKGQTADLKGPEKPTTHTPAQDQEKSAQGKDPTQVPAPAAGDKAKDKAKSAQDAKPAAQGQEKPAQGKDPAQTPAPAAGDKGKDGDKPAQDTKPTVQGQEKPAQGKDPAQAPAPAAGDKAKDGAKPAQDAKPTAQGDDFSDVDPAAVRAALAEYGIENGEVVDPAKLDASPFIQQVMADVERLEKLAQEQGPAQAPAPAATDKAKGRAKPAQDAKPAATQGQEKSAEEKDPAQTPAPAVTSPAAKGPVGTAIAQTLPERLSPPDEAAKKDFPAPQEGESIFVVLHPSYLVKSEYNTISVDTKSEDYQELKKSIELNGVKDPVLARIGNEGTLEIISGQRRHMIATELNYPVPTIIQKISDADAKILVADGNLHRPKISTYDLSRSLRMKMEGMKQKAGRRKKGSFKAEELYSDEKLAREMGMPVSKLNRLVRLSEATKDVCDRVDDGSLNLSLAHAISFLKPENQDEVLNMIDLGAKVPVERVEYMKKTEKAGKLNENTIRDILDGKNVLDPPKREAAQPDQPQPSAPAASDIPPSPDVAQPTHALDGPAAAQPGQAPEGAAPAASAQDQSQEGQEPADGKQERPEYTKVVLAGDRLRKYFPDVMMTPREIEESIYEALEERRQRQQKEKEKLTIFPKRGPKH